MGVIASLKPDNATEHNLIKLICTKFENAAGNWIAMWMSSFPVVGDPPDVTKKIFGIASRAPQRTFTILLLALIN